MGDFIEKRKKPHMPDKSIAVLYHRDCSDGFGAAWAAWKKFGDKANYIGMVHDHTDPPKWLAGKEVYLLDWCYTMPRLEKLRKMAKSVTILDHHVSLRAEIESVPDHMYGVENSGSVLSWMYFHPKKPVPILLRYIQDVDLWTLKMPDVWVVRASLYNMYPFDFKVWNKLQSDFEDKKKLERYKQEGRTIAAYDDKMIQKLFAKAELVDFHGTKALAVNSAMYSSELGSVLAKSFPPLGVVYSFVNGEARVSLRAYNEGKKKVDCAKFAEKYEGGGHKVAAGFIIPAGQPLPWKRIKK